MLTQIVKSFNGGYFASLKTSQHPVTISPIGINAECEHEINESEYQDCRNIIMAILTFEKPISGSSYGLKHMVEPFTKSGYVSNGTLIKVCVDLGLTVKWPMHGVNATIHTPRKDPLFFNRIYNRASKERVDRVTLKKH